MDTWLSNEGENNFDYRLFFEASADGAMLARTDGTILNINPKACSLLKRTREEVIVAGRDAIFDLSDPRLEPAFAKLREAGRFTGTLKLLRRGVTPFPAEVSMVAYAGNGVSSIVFREATEGKQVEEALRESEERFRMLTQATFEAIAIHEGGEILEVNDCFCATFGYDEPEEVVGKNVFDFAAPESRELVRKNVFSGYEEPYEAVGLRKDGTHFHGELRGTSLTYLRREVRVTTIRDVTERVRAEEALKESEAWFRSLIQYAPDLTIVAEADTTIRYISPSAERIWGYKPEEVIGTKATDHIHPEDLEGAVSAFAGTVDDSEATAAPGPTIRCRHKDGTWRYMEGFANNLLDDPHVRGLVFNSRDVTERVLAHNEIRRLNETLEKRVEERTALLADRERQLKELVGRIVTAQEEERRKVAYEIHDGLTQVATAAHQRLQAFARKYSPGSAVRAGELDRTLELAQLTVKEARKVIEGLRPTALDDFGLAVAIRQRVEEFENSEGLKVFYAETLGDERLPEEVETALYRVAQEALNNVNKHARTDEAHVTLARLPGKVRLKVEDRGLGFTPEESLRRGVGPGERVGLSSMRERVSLLGGELKVATEPGAGTSIIAEVPIARTS